MKKKTLIMLVSTVVLIASAAMGTVAYLTATTAPIVNTFTVGNVSIKVDETIVTPDGEPGDEDRNPLPPESEPIRAAEGNVYRLRPGMKYLKDPMMTIVKGSEDSYVRMLVTLNNMADLTTIFGADFLPETYVDGWDRELWPCTSVTDNGDDTVTYEFRYVEPVGAMGDADVELPELFTHFTIPGVLNAEQLKLLEDLQITVVGQAMQMIGFENADEAWAAFPTDETTTPTVPGEGAEGTEDTNP